MKCFEHEAPIDPSRMINWRKRIGKAGAEELLKESISASLKTKAVKTSQLKREHRMDRNRLKGTEGDMANAVLDTAGMNFSELLKWAPHFLFHFFKDHYGYLANISVKWLHDLWVFQDRPLDIHVASNLSVVLTKMIFHT